MHLDHAASSGSIAQEARTRMRELLALPLGNPSSPHREGRLARKVLREAREEAAEALGAREDEIVFTSGVTEALHLAISGLSPVASTLPVVTSAFEHRAVSNALPNALAVDPAHGAFPDAGLYVFSAVSNELGWRLDLDALPTSAPVIVDGAQAVLFAPEIWARPAVTALALPSHKIGGPTGVGLLALRSGRPFVRVLRGGHQENELRAGTEAVIAIAGFTRRLSSLLAQRAAVLAHLENVSRVFSERLLSNVRGARNFTALRPSAPGILALGITGVSGRQLLEALDAQGIAISSKSACASLTDASSPLAAVGISRERSLEAFRVSFHYDISIEDALLAADRIGTTARRLRGELQEVA